MSVQDTLGLSSGDVPAEATVQGSYVEGQQQHEVSQ